jgi:hypothetical protein
MQELDELMQQAKEKLQDQQEEQEESVDATEQEDIYSEFRNEDDTTEENYPDTEIEYSDPVYTEREVDIEHSPSEDIPEYYIDNNNSVFPGGPTVAQVDVWKKQFTNEKVFHVKIIEKDFIFRTLNRHEYKQIVAIENADSLFREEVICKTCVLFPFNYDFKTMAKEDSGYPSTLASIIMENSGFTTEYGIEVL